MPRWNLANGSTTRTTRPNRFRRRLARLWELAEDRFAQAIKTLDFQYARDHLWAVANSLHGQDTPEAKAWAEPLLRCLRKGRENQVVRQLEELIHNQSEESSESQELIEREGKFFVKHRDHLHYQAREKSRMNTTSGTDIYRQLAAVPPAALARDKSVDARVSGGIVLQNSNDPGYVGIF